ncbi:HAD family hydrolase [Longirhabdus pacifica]|uniref:HAD family hydrolase n=1 Tax=Longirhabdus pacifica TaxID=2305227 RepID=UPI0010091553|nr:HAD family hydrolase [Longirhabdus pacifica]
MNIKCVALDVDGTLLDDDHQCSSENIAAIREAHDKGIEIVLCTGRSPDSTYPILKNDIGIQGTLITHNGALTTDEHLKIVDECGFTIETVTQLVAYCREHAVQWDVNTASDIFCEHVSDEGAEMYKKFFLEPKRIDNVFELKDATILKFCCYGTISEMDQLEKQFASLHLDKLGLRMIRSGDFFIDVIHSDVGKGHALKQFVEQKGIKAEEVLAMGNYYNDLDMLQFAGLGIAVDNAPEEVKLSANEVTVSNNDNAVHTVLHQYILGNEVQAGKEK